MIPRYQEKSEILKSIIYYDNNIDDDEFEAFEEDWKDQNDTDHMPEIKSWNYENDLFSLQDILDQVPNGTNPKDIIISFDSDREKTYIEINIRKINR